MYTTFLFDLDGTLMETEVHKIEVKQEVMAALGLPLSHEDSVALMGKPREYVWRTLLQPLGREEEWLAHSEDYENRYLKRIEHGVPFTHGAESFLKQLKAAGYKLGLVTSSSQKMVDENPTLAPLLHLFDTVIHMGSVSKLKPDPMPYLQAMQNLGALPHETLAFEDSEAGFTATQQASIACVFVRHAFNNHLAAKGALHEISSYHTEFLQRIV